MRMKLNYSRIRTFSSWIMMILAFAVFTFAQEKATLIKNATIIDGTGKPAFRGDVRIRHGKIVKICVENGQPVEYGQRLFGVRPLR